MEIIFIVIFIRKIINKVTAFQKPWGTWVFFFLLNYFMLYLLGASIVVKMYPYAADIEFVKANPLLSLMMVAFVNLLGILGYYLTKFMFETQLKFENYEDS